MVFFQILEAQPLIIAKDAQSLSYLRWALDNLSTSTDFTALSSGNDAEIVELEAKVSF